MITGALDPDDGEVEVLGEDPRRFRRATRERIGYMPQQFTLYPDLTADENVDFVASPVRDARAGAAGGASARCWSSSSCGRRAAGGPASCRAACSAGSSSPPPSSTSRRCCSSTSPPRGSTRSCARRSGRSSHRLKADGRTLLVTTQYVGRGRVVRRRRAHRRRPADRPRAARGAPARRGGRRHHRGRDRGPVRPRRPRRQGGDPRGAEHRAPASSGS